MILILVLIEHLLLSSAAVCKQSESSSRIDSRFFFYKTDLKILNRSLSIQHPNMVLKKLHFVLFAV